MIEICIISEQPHASDLGTEGPSPTPSTPAASTISLIWLKVVVWKVPWGNVKESSPELGDSASQRWSRKVENIKSRTKRENTETTVSKIKKFANIDNV